MNTHNKNCTREKVTIYTDGACSGNPGPGGWGAILIDEAGQRELMGGEKHTTNNRMELLGAIEALERILRPSFIELHTDSSYLKKGISQWIHTWKKNGWKTSAKKSVKNVQLWKRLSALCSQHEIEWKWVRGHSGDPGNERADELARQGMAPYIKKVSEKN